MLTLATLQQGTKKVTVDEGLANVIVFVLPTDEQLKRWANAVNEQLHKVMLSGESSHEVKLFHLGLCCGDSGRLDVFGSELLQQMTFLDQRVEQQGLTRLETFEALFHKERNNKSDKICHLVGKPDYTPTRTERGSEFGWCYQYYVEESPLTIPGLKVWETKCDTAYDGLTKNACDLARSRHDAQLHDIAQHMQAFCQRTWKDVPVCIVYDENRLEWSLKFEWGAGEDAEVKLARLDEEKRHGKWVKARNNHDNIRKQKRAKMEN